MLRTHGCFAKNCGDVTARILLILSLALFSIAANADTIDLSKLSQKNFNVKQHLYYMELGEQLLTTAQIPGVSDSQFLSNKLTPYSPDLGASALYRLNLFNDTKRQRRLTVHIDNPMIDRLELVFVVNNAVVKRELLGDKQQPEFALKSSLPHFTFELAPQQSGKVYIQASSQGSTLFPLSLYDDTEFQTRVYQSFLTWGAFIGVILMITAYNILLLIGIKNKIYLFYLGYILSMLIQLGTV